MKTVQVNRFGDPAVLQLTDLPDPSPSPGEITIDVTHAAVGLVDVFLRQGQFKDVPAMAQPPFSPGLEVTGTVRALGNGVQEFRSGLRVVAISAGWHGWLCIGLHRQSKAFNFPGGYRH